MSLLGGMFDELCPCWMLKAVWDLSPCRNPYPRNAKNGGPYRLVIILQIGACSYTLAARSLPENRPLVNASDGERCKAQACLPGEPHRRAGPQ